MLIFNPSKRATIDEAIAHEFFHDLHCDEDEPTTHPVDAFDFDFEKYDLSIEELKEEIQEEIKLYHSSKSQKKYIANRKKHPNGMLHIKYGEPKHSSDKNIKAVKERKKTKK
jgi:mitogen-activated protein kinase 1/3